MRENPYAIQVDRLRRAVINGPGVLDFATRHRGATGGSEFRPELASYVEKVRHHPNRVTDEDFAQMKEAGYTEDQIFEITISTALGTGLWRLNKALRVLDKASQNETHER